MNSLFVTGTDTGIGKTVLTAAIVAAARAAGHDVLPMKPVQTGCDTLGGLLAPPDVADVLRLAGMGASEDAMGDICPYRFEPACSPHLAATQDARPIEIARIVACFERLRDRYDAVVVEGAGGVLVPLNDRETMRDLMRALGVEVVIASRPGLGTLNHTLLTVEALQHAGLAVRAIVIVQSTGTPPGDIEDDNRRTLAARTGLPVLGPLPFIPDLDNPSFTPQQFLRMVEPTVTPLL